MQCFGILRTSLCLVPLRTIGARTIGTHAAAQVWQEEDMISSFDGFSVWRDWRATSLNSDAEQWKTNTGWYHVDQNPLTKPTREVLQGLVNLIDMSPHTGGNVLIPKSGTWQSVCVCGDARVHVRVCKETSSSVVVYVSVLVCVWGVCCCGAECVHVVFAQ